MGHIITYNIVNVNRRLKKGTGKIQQLGQVHDLSSGGLLVTGWHIEAHPKSTVPGMEVTKHTVYILGQDVRTIAIFYKEEQSEQLREEFENE